MHRATDASTHTPASSNGGGSTAPAAAELVDPANEGHVCPFCGLTREITEDFDASAPCPRCTLADTPTTRNATKARIGPWHVRQMRNPWAPGMRWETLLALIKRGQVTRDSIVRGPTTHQLWRRASEVKGLSREFGLCYSCGGEIDTQANLCSHCNRLQEPPVNPNVLVETREFTQQQSPPQVPSKSPPASPQAAARQAAPAIAPTTPRSNGQRQQQARRDDGEAPPLDVGATTPVVSNPQELLTVEDPEQAAALARAITSRAPTRPPRPHPPVQAAAPKEMATAGVGDAASAPATPAVAGKTSPEEQLRPIPLRPRQSGVDDALLTPQELAAAFQLNFVGGAGAGTMGGVARPEAPVSTGTVDDFFPLQRRKRSKVFIAFVLLLLVAAGAAVLMWVRPDLREQAADWSQKKYTAAKQFVEARTSPAPDKPTLEPLPLPAPSTTVRAASPAGKSSSPTTRPQPIVITPPALAQQSAAAQKSDEVTADRKIAPSPLPAPRAPTTRETTRVLAPVLETPVAASSKSDASAAPSPSPAPATRPEPPRVPPSPISPPSQPKVWTSVAEAEEEARRLWRQAIDAEQNQDYVEAVRSYELIKKLPEEVQPRGIDVRLKLAQKLVK